MKRVYCDCILDGILCYALMASFRVSADLLNSQMPREISSSIIFALIITPYDMEMSLAMVYAHFSNKGFADEFGGRNDSVAHVAPDVTSRIR